MAGVVLLVKGVNPSHELVSTDYLVVCKRADHFH